MMNVTAKVAEMALIDSERLSISTFKPVSRLNIRKARRDNPSAKIIITGCSAQIDPQSYAQMEEVDQVIGNDLKLKAETWQGLNGEKVVVNDIMTVKETAGHLIQGFESRARAIVQVQNGCDHRCTFCIIPYGRGNSRSVPIGVIVDGSGRHAFVAHANADVITEIDLATGEIVRSLRAGKEPDGMGFSARAAER